VQRQLATPQHPLRPPPPTTTTSSLANEVLSFHRWSDEIRKMEVDYCVQEKGGQWCVGVYCILRVYFLVNGTPLCWR